MQSHRGCTHMQKHLSDSWSVKPLSNLCVWERGKCHPCVCLSLWVVVGVTLIVVTKMQKSISYSSSDMLSRCSGVLSPPHPQGLIHASMLHNTTHILQMYTGKQDANLMIAWGRTRFVVFGWKRRELYKLIYIMWTFAATQVQQAWIGLKHKWKSLKSNLDFICIQDS